MAWTLKDLIKASGYSGVTGQSFRNNVVGAVSGARVSDYKQTAASWDVHTFTGLFPSSSSFQCNLTLTENARAYLFRNSDCVVLDQATSGVSKSGSIINVSTGVAYQQVVVQGNLDLSSAGISSTTTVPSSPYSTPGTQLNLVRFIANVNSGTASGDDFFGWRLTLPQVNTGYPFNTYAGVGGIVGGQYEADVRRRTPAVTDYDLEWYNDNLFSSLYGTGASVNWTQTAVGQDKTLWLQWRIKPALNGGITTWNQRATGQTFTDTRA